VGGAFTLKYTGRGGSLGWTTTQGPEKEGSQKARASAGGLISMGVGASITVAGTPGARRLENSSAAAVQGVGENRFFPERREASKRGRNPCKLEVPAEGRFFA